MIGVVGVGGLVCIGCNNSAVAVVVDVGEEVVEDGAHFDRCEGRGVAALLGDTVTGAEVVAGAAREHAGALLASRALHALVAGTVVAAYATVFDVTVSPDAAIVDARCGTGCIARIAHTGVIGAGSVAGAGGRGGASGRRLALCEAPRSVGRVRGGGWRPAAAALLALRFVDA